MNGTIIIPVTKSPHAKGRVGPEKWQDWYQGVKKAVSIAKRLGIRTEILILSNAQYTGQPHEADLYRKAIDKLGRIGVNLRIMRKGQETIEQVKKSFYLAIKEDKNLIFVSTFFHYPRVQWLIWRYRHNIAAARVKHRIAFGIPRPREMLTDIVLALLFPLIDIFGGRQFFLKAVNRRRIKGKL